MRINAVINGILISRECDPTMRLLDFLRNEMDLKSVKEGCGEGECGSCSILFDRAAVASCTMLTGQIHGHEIMTLEGLEQSGEVEALAEAFVKAGAVQCGYCTPGMIISARALLDSNPDPSAEEIKRAIEGNLCRCTGYSKIVAAIQSVRSDSHE